jgi:predicted transposase YdaD
LLELPDELEQNFQQDLQRFEQERQMPYITSIERRAKQEGLQEGLQHEARSLVLKQLTRKLGEIPSNVRSQVESLSVEQLEALGEALLDFANLDDLMNWLRSASTTKVDRTNGGSNTTR